MDADAFLDWAVQRPNGERYELVAGEVFAMARETVGHARCKARIYGALAQAIEAAGIHGEVFPDGMAVRIDSATVCEPDAMLRCGPPLSDEALEVADPLVIVEIRAPGSPARDAGAKLDDYFRIPSVRHYLLVKTDNRTVIHHERDAAGTIATRILRDAPVPLDPPGIVLEGIFDK